MTTLEDYKDALQEAEAASLLFAKKLCTVAEVGKELGAEDDALSAGPAIESYRRMVTTLRHVAAQHKGVKELLADALGMVPQTPIRDAMGGG